MTTEESKFVVCPSGGCFEDDTHVVIHSISGGVALCGKMVTVVIDHGPRGLVEISAYTLGALASVMMVPLKLAARKVASTS